MAPNAPPEMSERASRLRTPAIASAMQANAAIDEPTAMITRWPTPDTGASPPRVSAWRAAAGTAALPAMRNRCDPRRLRRSQSTSR